MDETAKEVVQSYAITTAKYNFNVHEKRILYKIIEYSQPFLDGQKLNNDFDPIKLINNKFVEIELQTSDLTIEKQNNHNLIWDALKSLANKGIEFGNDEKDCFAHLIDFPEIYKTGEKRGKVAFSIHKEVWKALLDFSKGWRKYDLDIAMNLRKVNAMRMYELISNQHETKYYSIEKLREIFNIKPEQYKQTADLIKRILKPTQEELNEKADYSFTYKTILQGHKVKSIEIIPIKVNQRIHVKLDSKRIMQNYSLSLDIPKQIQEYLYNSFGFNEKGLQSNRELFANICRKYNTEELIDILSEIKETILKRRDEIHNIQGYLINSLKSRIN